MSHLIVRFLKDEDGATAVEYAILVGVVVVAIAGLLATFGEELGKFFNGMWTKIESETNITRE